MTPASRKAERMGCPGASEYGHGMSRTVVHAGGCCEAWRDKMEGGEMDDQLTRNEQAAQELLNAANALGRAMTAVEALYRAGQLNGEVANCDTIVISGPDVMSALRRLSMRLDRATYMNWVEGRE